MPQYLLILLYIDAGSSGEEDLSSDEEEPAGVSWSRPSHLWISRKDQRDLKDFQVCRTALLLFLPTEYDCCCSVSDLGSITILIIIEVDIVYRGSENVLNVLYIIPAYTCTRLHIAWSLTNCTVHVDGRAIMCCYCYIILKIYTCICM